MEEKKKIVMTAILNSAETAAVTNDSMHVESVKHSSEGSMDDEDETRQGCTLCHPKSCSDDVSSPSPQRLHIK